MVDPRIQWQEEYGRLMKALAHAEGHAPKNHYKSSVTRSSAKRKALRKFFKEYRKPNRVITVKEIERAVEASPDTIRRICTEFVNEGWLIRTRTKRGFVYAVLRTKLRKMHID